mmetsp:Transcript_23158/g.38290  ORF Transcript_23158/g.38290 Transcript_23158/m.38290 type:complete len:401 (-) Transcript_23158:120-1322(-)|eukprot:CAMPEP_0119005566 /NCGR_PEP_ID=MMETSP1176-20130426/1802_1 /TAXON_ID=265551 /ORGANISM="Synedropsis recta cf, Strain CCMP1620" /LENGTH=400 /DNA_ID=CAMNT_0006957397 /DNA_START=84 /DNA_END=1286 /DNA_ORIENTATION=+
MVSIRSRRQGKSLVWLDRTLAVIFVVLFYEFWWKDRISGGIGSSFDDYSLLQQRVCAQNKGIVVVNFLDYLGYNLLQIGFARRIAEDLCWDVVTYRSMWKPGFGPDEEKCFSNALTPPLSSESLSPELFKEIGMNDALWSALNDHPMELGEAYEPQNLMVKEWSKGLEAEGKAWRCVTALCDFSEEAIQQQIAKIRSKDSTIRVVYLEDFFLHYEWMDQWRSHLRNWFSTNKEADSSCCSQVPPEDAVVIHVHTGSESEPIDGKLEDLKVGVEQYAKLVSKYHGKKKSVWIVCNAATFQSQYVKDLSIQLGGTNVVVPKSASDTVCILSKAKEGLFVTPNHILSMVGGLLSNAAEVHYLTPNTETRFGLNVTDWKYHVVENEKLKYWNVRHKNLAFLTPW